MCKKLVPVIVAAVVSAIIATCCLAIQAQKMSLVFANCVMETTTTTGTGSLSLDGAVVGFQPFSVIGDGNQCYACVHAVDENGKRTGQWEVFLGTYSSSGNMLARTETLESSTGSTVDFAAGTKIVLLGIPSQEVGPARRLNQVVTGANVEHVLKNTKTSDGYGGNVLRLQQTNPDYFSCVYCVAHDVEDGQEGRGAAFGWGNSGGTGVFAGRAYVESYDALSGSFRPFVVVQTQFFNAFRRYEADADGNQTFYRRDVKWPDETPQLTLDAAGNVVVGSTVATDATNGFFRIPSCAGTPTGAAADGSMVRDSTNHKVYFRSGGNWIALN